MVSQPDVTEASESVVFVMLLETVKIVVKRDTSELG
jgi:hypothetical protein